MKMVGYYKPQHSDEIFLLNCYIVVAEFVNFPDRGCGGSGENILLRV